jgi:hypothetical protein
MAADASEATRSVTCISWGLSLTCSSAWPCACSQAIWRCARLPALSWSISLGGAGHRRWWVACSCSCCLRQYGQSPCQSVGGQDCLCMVRDTGVARCGVSGNESLEHGQPAWAGQQYYRTLVSRLIRKRRIKEGYRRTAWRKYGRAMTAPAPSHPGCPPHPPCLGATDDHVVLRCVRYCQGLSQGKGRR